MLKWQQHSLSLASCRPLVLLTVATCGLHCFVS